MDELSHVFSPVAEKEPLVDAARLLGELLLVSSAQPAFALKRKVRKTEPRGGFIELKIHTFEQGTA